ncbi:MAG: lysine--tRNA ligase [candidate division WOR-3 bacterium]|nr:lysine--tRNA ligase [candidate division WOR-3 bacterium]
MVEKTHIHDEFILRKDKLQKLISQNALSYRFDRTHTAEEIIKSFTQLSETKMAVRVAGRIVAIREHGKTKFAHLQDQSGKIQIYLRKDFLGDSFDNLDLVDIGDILGIEGEVFKTKTQEITVLVKSYQILNKSLHPMPEKWHGLKDVEVRYRQRYLDLIANPESKKILLLRIQIISLLRKFFDSKGFVEVETPILQPIYGGASARPFETYYNALDEKMFMRISDELYLKRLIIGGLEKVYEIGKDFRNEGLDRFHNPEFTQLEAYEAYKDYNDMMLLVEELFRFLCTNLFQSTTITYQDKTLDFSRPWQRVEFCSSLKAKIGIDVLSAETKKLREIAIEFGVIDKDVAPIITLPKLLDKLFSTLIQKELIEPTFVIDYPKITTPLARRHRNNPLLVERFEPIICGIEIGNAFSELNDPIEQRARFEEQLARQEEYATLDEDFLRALEYGMPPTAGLGLGVDRIVMLLTNSDSIREVIPFPQLKRIAD